MSVKLDTVTLALSGDVPLGEFAVAIEAFRNLVSQLTREIATVDVDWSIHQLDIGSTLVTARGQAQREEEVERVVRAYDDVGRKLSAGEQVPTYVRSAADQLLTVLNGRITDIRFETAEADRIISARPAPDDTELSEPEWAAGARSLGAVQGRIQTLSSRGSLRFTLYDTVHDKAVSCYLSEGQEELMRGLWGELATVEGMVQRDPRAGRPLSVRQIRKVTRLPERDEDAWRRARGALPRRDGDQAAEDAIRQVRDAW